MQRMGVKDLLGLLRSKCPQVFKSVPSASRYIVDVAIFMHKFIHAEGKVHMDNICERFFDLSQTLHNPIFVFDGKKLDAKNLERQKRILVSQRSHELWKEKSTHVDFEENGDMIRIELVNCVERPANFLLPTADDYSLLWNFLCCKQQECRRAEYEAEALATHLCKEIPGSIVITEDSDVLMYACPRTIFKYGSEKQVYVDYDDILKALKITDAQFKLLCILLGNDFNDRIPGVGPVKAFQLLLNVPTVSWETVEKELQSQTNKKQFSDENIHQFAEGYAITEKIIQTCCYENCI